jgi:ACS family glucarate transporter-like MFS transporter
MTQNSVSATATIPPATLPLEGAAVADGPATRVRYGVLFFLCTLALLLYVDRMCIGQAAQSIERELGLSKTQLALVFNAFTLAYCLFEVPTGHWGDRFGSRGVIARIVVWWSIFTALTGAAMGFYSLLAIRFLFGAGEAGAYPNTARVVTRWFPPSGRGFARGAITFLSLVGGALAPILAGYMIGLVGWRMMFAIFGGVGVLWVAAFYLWFRDDPAEHRSTNAAERALIAAGRGADDAAHADGVHARIPWGIVLTSRNTWMLSASMGVSAICMYIQFQWFPTYLKEARGQGEVSSGWLSGMVMGGGAVGCLAGGLVADWVTRHARSPEAVSRGRRFCGAGALLLAAVSALSVRAVDSAFAVALCNASALFFVQAAIPTWWSVVAEISGRHGAAMWGLMNSMAGLGLLTTTILVGMWVQRQTALGVAPVAAWGPIFDWVAIGLILGSLSWLAVNPRKSIVSRPDPHGFPLDA